MHIPKVSVPRCFALCACISSLLALPAPAAPEEAPKAATPNIVPTAFFTVPEGLEVTVWASTPQLFNPTNIDFDKDGRLWVAEGVNYRSHFKRRPEGDRIMVLEDTTGAGHADKSEVFLQDPSFISPLGLAVLDDKVVVSQPPELLAFTDVNHDRKFDPAVDKREVLLSGFNGFNHDHSLHSVTAGPDGLWYFNHGNTGAMFTDKSGKTFRIGGAYFPGKERMVKDPTAYAGEKSDDGRVWVGGFTARMNPDGTDLAIIGFNYRNSYEQAVDSLGDIFQSDNDDPPACRVAAVLEYGNAGYFSSNGQRTWVGDRRPGQDIPTAEWRQEDPGTMPSGDVYGGGAPTGVVMYENGAMEKQWSGLLLAGEAGRNVVFGYLPKPKGAGFTLDRFDFMTSNKEREFAGSDFQGSKENSEMKTRFRPSDIAVGPDGAIYVADWFDPRVGGHADLDATTSGTIYRIAPKGFKSVIPKIDLTTTEGQITALKSPAINVRNSGFTRLKAQGEKAVPAVAALLSESNPFIAARATWLLAQMGPAGVAKVTALLESKDDTVRLVAFRALRRAGQDIVTLAAKCATDSSAAIRREVALSLRDVPYEKSGDALLKIARAFDGQDRAYLEAFGTGCDGKEEQIYAQLAQENAQAGDATQWTDTFAWLAWRLHVPAAAADLKTRALSGAVSAPQRKLAMDALAFVVSADAAAGMTDIATTPDFPFAENAKWWLKNRTFGSWEAFDVGTMMEKKGLPNPEKVKLTSITAAPAPEGVPELPPVSEILKLEGNAERGEAAVAVCYTCHRIGKQGAEFGPTLTAFGKQQTREVIIRSIVEPSADISLGYDGTRVETTDGIVIDGIVTSRRGPVTVKSVGNVSQTVAKRRVKSLTPLQKSLMLPPQSLGLTPQSIADIAAYLQSDRIK